MNNIKILVTLMIITSLTGIYSSAIENSKPETTTEQKAAPEVDTSRFGIGKAVEAFDKENGFKLSERAIKSLSISFNQLNGAGPWRVPKEAIVHLKQSAGIYRRYEGWVSMVLIKVVGKENGSILIQSADIEPGDEVATSGVQFLRMTDADLNSGTVDSCAH